MIRVISVVILSRFLSSADLIVLLIIALILFSGFCRVCWKSLSLCMALRWYAVLWWVVSVPLAPKESPNDMSGWNTSLPTLTFLLLETKVQSCPILEHSGLINKTQALQKNPCFEGLIVNHSLNWDNAFKLAYLFWLPRMIYGISNLSSGWKHFLSAFSISELFILVLKLSINPKSTYP